MVKARLFLLVTTVSAYAPPSSIVLEPQEGTPCLSSCEEDPLNDSCKRCCQRVKHEVDWKCDAASSDGKAACCENWNSQCWNVASEQNLGHACNQCRAREPNMDSNDPDTAESDGSVWYSDSDTSSS